MGQCFFSSVLLGANVDMVSCSVPASYCKQAQGFDFAVNSCKNRERVVPFSVHVIIK